MAIAAVLLLIVIGSVLFHWFTPWWATPLASNWQQMDDTLAITLVITGVFFVAIMLFLIYTLWRYRHHAGSGTGRRAAYEPENPRLERWLIGITTLGIVGLLAPGLVVYAEYVRPPPDALVLEIVGQQWQWRFRFPGASGALGGSDARFVSAGNPFGLDPADPRGLDNILVAGNEVHLPLGRPVKVLMRSHDVLHDFFVPPFRARMNIVPGQVSSFWFTPTRAGRFESMCAQLCGVGHANMRGFVVVEPEAAFRAWLAKQPTFAMTLAARATAGAGADTPAALGARLAQSKGCVACHSIDGSARVGPSWKGLFGKTEQLDDGASVVVDEAFLKGFIRNPTARSIKGYPALMPRIELTDAELDALVAHIKAQASQ
ncbi:MAG: cytochrome c oxidase subunit II [Burkholderiaceae bacterium]